ncbi:MAG: tRNA (adenosine(37)-N6)-threonylcarbamoyltransferase complex transferase subunit TsaD [Acidimicrobiales bacterium]
MRLLALETSCDETAAAVVEDGRRVLSSVVASQVQRHRPFGGVVPEVAGRAHLELLTPVVARALEEADTDPRELDAVAATLGPGLIGSLLVGTAAAKAYALAWGKAYVGVNHMEGHLHAVFLEDPALVLPAVVLLVSGGHTMLVLMDGEGRYRLLGRTLDDAAGEAFDKVARYLGLAYPGGPAIEIAATSGDPAAIAFPRGLHGEGYDFSFSGLKTAVVRYVDAHPEASLEDLAASFQEAVVDVCATKARRAAADLDARSICLGGGVAANTALRQRIADVCALDGRVAVLPSRATCTDNAAMIGAAAWYRLRVDGPTPLGAAADPNLGLPFLP